MQVERGGVIGHGEASANAYYGEDPDDVAARLGQMEGFLAGCALDSPGDIAVIWEEAWAVLTPSRAAQCALDVALWDWLAMRNGCTVTELALGQKPRPVVSFATLGLSEPEEIGRKIAEVAGFPRIKIKVDGAADLAAARRVREAMPEATVAVDANCAWGEVDFAKIGNELAELWVEFVEQPLPPQRDGEMPDLSERFPVPLMADESCVTLDDVPRMQKEFCGIQYQAVEMWRPHPRIAHGAEGEGIGIAHDGGLHAGEQPADCGGRGGGPDHGLCGPRWRLASR